MLGLRGIVSEVVARSVLTTHELCAAFADAQGLQDPTRMQSHSGRPPDRGGGGIAGAAVTIPAGRAARSISPLGSRKHSPISSVSHTPVDACVLPAVPAALPGTGLPTSVESMRFGDAAPETKAISADPLQSVCEMMCGLRGLSPLPMTPRVQAQTQKFFSCWLGCDAVTWMQQQGIVDSRATGLCVGTRMLQRRVAFKVDAAACVMHDAPMLYTFQRDDLQWPLCHMTEATDTQLPRAVGVGGVHDQERVLWTKLLSQLPRLHIARLDLPRILHDMTSSLIARAELEVKRVGSTSRQHPSIATTVRFSASSSPSSASSVSTFASQASSSSLFSFNAQSASGRSSAVSNGDRPRRPPMLQQSPVESLPQHQELCLALRLTGHFRGSELITYLMQQGHTTCTRDAMILATYLLKVPMHEPWRAPAAAASGFFRVVGREGKLSGTLQAKVMALATAEHVERERERELASYDGLLSSLDGESDSFVLGSERSLRRRHSSRSHSSSPLGSVGLSGAEDVLMPLPAARPPASAVTTPVSSGAHAVHTTSASLTEAYHVFLASSEHTLATEFAVRDTFKNAHDVWYKLCVTPPPPSPSTNAQQEQMDTLLPGMTPPPEEEVLAVSERARALHVLAPVLPQRQQALLPWAASDAAALEQSLPAMVRPHPHASVQLASAAAAASPAVPAAESAIVPEARPIVTVPAVPASLPIPSSAGTAHAAALTTAHAASSSAVAAASASAVSAAASSPAALFPDLVFDFADVLEDVSRGEGGGDDIVALEFHPSGSHLAIADCRGTITLNREVITDEGCIRYDPMAEWFINNDEFDPRNSHYGLYENESLYEQDMPSYINALEWWPTTNALSILAATDKCVKLFRINENGSSPHYKRSWKSMFGERLHEHDDEEDEEEAAADADPPPPYISCRATFQHPKTDMLINVAASSDGASFIAADSHRINHWYAERPNQCHPVMDLQAQPMHNSQELLSVVRMHPTAGDTLLYASSMGTMCVHDLRHSYRLGAPTLRMAAPSVASGPAHIDMMSRVISDAKFSADGRYVVSRDYLTVRLWDTLYTRYPLYTAQVHPQLASPGLMAEAASNSCMLDSFQVSLSSDALHVLTGSYSSAFTVHNVMARSNQTFALRDDLPRADRVEYDAAAGVSGSMLEQAEKTGARVPAAALSATCSPSAGVPGPNRAPPDFSAHVLRVAWHPIHNVVAVASVDKVFVYQDANEDL